MRNKILSILFIFVIAFYFEGNRLCWINTEEDNQSANFLKFQLDYKNPPTTNQENIKYIIQNKKTVEVITKSKYWILHYSPDYYDWYVEDWQPIVNAR